MHLVALAVAALGVNSESLGAGPVPPPPLFLVYFLPLFVQGAARLAHLAALAKALSCNAGAGTQIETNLVALAEAVLEADPQSLGAGPVAPPGVCHEYEDPLWLLRRQRFPCRRCAQCKATLAERVQAHFPWECASSCERDLG